MIFKRKPVVNFLSLIPERRIKDTEETDGKVTLLVPKFKKPIFRKWLIPGRKTSVIRIHLDETGSMVWKRIDDTSTVEAICSDLKTRLESQQKNTDHMEERVTKYLSHLLKGGLIRMNIPGTRVS